MANELITILNAQSGTYTWNERANDQRLIFLTGQSLNLNFLYGQRSNGFMPDLIPKRFTYGGAGYIAGKLPGIVTVEGTPAKRFLELRRRDGRRDLIATQWSNLNGTYRFDDIDPYIQYDIVAKDAPDYVFNDVIVGGIWPWTDDFIILRGLATPKETGAAFTRTLEVTGGTLPYSIGNNSSLPTGTTATLNGRTLTITSGSNPPDSIFIVINDNAGHSKSILVLNKASGQPYTSYRLNVKTNNGHANSALSELEMVDKNGSTILNNGSAFGSATLTGYEPNQAFDLVKGGIPGWISTSQNGMLGFNLSVPKSFAEARLTARSTDLTQLPKSFTIDGGNDGTYTELMAVYEQTNWSPNSTRYFSKVDPYFGNVAAVMASDVTVAPNGNWLDAKGVKHYLGNSASVVRDASGFGGSYIQFSNNTTNATCVTDSYEPLAILSKGDYTVECFVSFDEAPNGGTNYYIIGSDDNYYDGWNIRINGNGIEIVYPYLGFGAMPFTFEAGKVYHIFVSRIGSQHYLGVNGTSQAVSVSNRTTDSSTYGRRIRLGSHWYGNGWAGKISHRVTQGVARYADGGYVVPVAPFGEAAPPTISKPANTSFRSLLHFNETIGTTTVFDRAQRVWTASGTCSVSARQSRFGKSWRTYGADSKLSTAAGIIGTGEKFCVDGWIWCDPSGGAQGGAHSQGFYCLFGQGGTGGASDQFVSIFDDGRIQYYKGPTISAEGEKSIMTATGLFPRGMWHHVMLTFDGAMMRLYANGAKVGEVASTEGWKNTGEPFTVGHQLVLNYPEYRHGHNGYIDEFRVMTGDAVVTTDTYVVPVAPYENPAPVTTTDDFATNASLSNYTQMADSNGTWSISGGKLVATSTNQSMFLRNGQTFADGEVSAVITESNDSGLVLRVKDNANYYILGIYDQDSGVGFNNRCRLYKRISGSYTMIGDWTFGTWTRGTPNTFSLAIEGSTLTVKLNGSVLGVVADTSITGHGQFGPRAHTGPNVFESFSWTV